MNFKKAIISYLPHKRTENARNKKIIFFAIMKPLKADNAKQNRQSKTQKKGLISWKTKTLKRMHLLH
ncbi:type I restriction endonuclease subunit M [Helicobacter pylori]|uniref:type I restriction endonuclease subunit M n=1 Tax=Helicobacter pylori TaxID=210 RepID=UPI002928B4B7|nr:type I restriction endonuclease subunit M [Helicobacter pylori]MDU9770274.1 type I restriction endonuclease subunit M [Helicobacter pylori]